MKRQNETTVNRRRITVCILSCILTRPLRRKQQAKLNTLLSGYYISKTLPNSREATRLCCGPPGPLAGCLPATSPARRSVSRADPGPHPIPSHPQARWRASLDPDRGWRPGKGKKVYCTGARVPINRTSFAMPIIIFRHAPQDDRQINCGLLTIHILEIQGSI